jgi:hypothetical protein
MAKLDMTGNGKKVTITTGQKPLDGIDFSGQQKCDDLWTALNRAHGRAQYYTTQMMRAEHDRNNTTDKIKILKKNQEIEHYKNYYKDSKKEATRLENILKISDKRRD